MRWNFQLSRKWRDRLNRWTGGTIEYIFYPYFMLVNAVSWVIQLLVRAWHTRHFRYLVHGFPALFALAGVIWAVVTVAIGQAQERRANLSKDYMGQVGEAWKSAASVTGTTDADKAKRLEYLMQARSYIEKALVLEDGARDDYKYHLASLLFLMGGDDEVKQGYAIMAKLAPDDANGYAQAHLWRGQDLMRQFRLQSPEINAAVERHFTRAYESSKNDADPSLMQFAALCLGNFYAIQGRWKEALPYVEKIEDKYPMHRLALGRIYKELGRPEDAKKAFRSAENHFRDKTMQKVDDKGSRLIWGQALFAQEKYQEVIEAMHKGMVMNQDVEFQQLVSESFRAWELKLAKDPKANLGERLTLIQQGIQAWPFSVALLGRMHDMSTLKTPEGQAARKEVEKMIADGRGQAPILLFFMGSYAYAEGRIDEARSFWEKAYNLDQSFALAANNLAWLLIHDEKSPDVDRALEMMEKLVAKYPNYSNFYGTRGEARTKKKQYKDAVPDLLKGLAAKPDDLSLNESIAECYEALGDRTLAEIHRKKAAELKAKNLKRNIDSPEVPTVPGDPANLPAEIPIKSPIKEKEKEKGADKPGGN